MLALALTALALAAPLPDLDQATPFGVSVVHRDGRSLLVFGSAVDNVGRGPLVVEAQRVGGEMRTWQVIGGRRIALPVRLRYVRSETHRHWHFPASSGTSCGAWTAASSVAIARPASASATPTRRGP